MACDTSLSTSTHELSHKNEYMYLFKLSTNRLVFHYLKAASWRPIPRRIFGGLCDA